MADTPIIVTPNLMPDPTGCMPGDRQSLANFCASAITVTFGSSTGGTTYTSVVSGSTTPPPEQQGAIWFKTETSGMPIGPFMFFNGKWTRTGLPLYSIQAYSGPSSNFSGGKGIAGTQVEGYVLCDGTNGSPDLRDRFIVGTTTYSGAWRTNVDPSNPSAISGGAAQVQLGYPNLPQIPIVLPIGTGSGAQQRFNFGTLNSTGDGSYNGYVNSTGNGVGDSPQPAAPHQNLPPYYALAYMMFLPTV